MAIIHGKCHSLDQLVFAVNAAMTTSKCEDSDTIDFITTMKGKKPRLGMAKMGEMGEQGGRSSAIY